MDEKRRLLLRPTEAAESLGLSRARLYQLMASGEITSVKIGASRRIRASELERFVNALDEDQGGEAGLAGRQHAA